MNAVLGSSSLQVGSGRTFQVQVQPARQCQRSTGQVVAEETHRSLLPSCEPGRTQGLLPIQELAPSAFTAEQKVKPWALKVTVKKGGIRFHEELFHWYRASTHLFPHDVRVFVKLSIKGGKLPTFVYLNECTFYIKRDLHICNDQLPCFFLCVWFMQRDVPPYLCLFRQSFR